MAGVSQHISLSDLAPQLASDLAPLEGGIADLSPTMAIIAKSLEDSTVDRFVTGTSPNGDMWLPSQRALSEGGKTLVDTARLMQSITSASGRNWAEVGTNVEYAGVHQFGATIKHEARQQTIYRRLNGRTGELTSQFVKRSRSNFAQDVAVGAYEVEIAAREFLGVSDEDELSIIEIITDHFWEAVA